MSMETVLGLIKEYSGVSAGLSVAITGAVLMILKSLPAMISRGFMSHFTTRLQVKNSDMSFYYVSAWLQKNPGLKWSRSWQLLNGFHGRSEESQLSPGRGWHLATYKGSLFFVNLSEESGGSLREKPTQTIQLLHVGRDVTKLKSMVVELGAKALRDPTRTYIYSYDYNGWTVSGSTQKRSFTSVIVNPETKTKLLGHVDRFLSAKTSYLASGITYKTGILLYGPPGTGKTSIIRAMAEKYNWDLAILPATIDGAVLKKALMTAPENAVLVIEDVDSMQGAKTREQPVVVMEEKDQVSSVLNALDGVGTYEDRILIMTTNHLEKLDPAFIRPGRIDLLLQIPPLTRVDAEKVLGKLPDALGEAIRGCDLQPYVIEKLLA